MTSRRTNLSLVSVGLVTLLLAPGNTWADHPVERPFKIKGSSTMVVTLGAMSYEANGSGQATHCGQITVVGTGDVGMGGSGSIMCANGDTLSFTDSAEGKVTILDGTGRFEGATGTFTIAAQVISRVIDGGTMTIKYTWTGTGTIKF
jgi:hypothetical protein